MDTIILGLLLLKSRTIYQLRERIDKGLNLMYSSSMGSIQAALKKLSARGCIQYEETSDKGRRKKIYSITDSGRQYFLEWVNSPMPMQSGKNPELARLYFMGFAAEENREELIQSYIVQLREHYDTLDFICREGESTPVADESRDILFYQLASARYGRDLMEFNLKWYQKLLKEMRKQEHETD